MSFVGVVGWCDGTGKVRVLGLHAVLVIVGHGPAALAVDAGVFGFFFSPLSFLSSFSFSLGGGPI